VIRIVIADDHPVVRKGLLRILEDQDDVRVVAEVASGEDLLQRLASTRADVVLLDISMPGPGFLELLRRVCDEHPRTRVLVLSIHAEDQYAVQAIHCGAAGYVMKDRPPEELIAAIRRVHSGGRHVSPAIAAKLEADSKRSPGRAPHEALSPREFDVMGMLAAGLGVKQIADDLGLSPKTVSTFRARILKKMGFRSNAEIVRYLVERRMLA
jgi:two-component system, NarL family, invasion response regulator UvrY